MECPSGLAAKVSLVFSQNRDGFLDLAELAALMDPRGYISGLNEVSGG